MLILFPGCALLCGAYITLWVLTLGHFIDLGGTPSGSVSLLSITGIRTFFATDAGLMVGWMHYLAIDLYAGIWMARDADSKGVSRLAQTPLLSVTFALAPISVLTWLIIRKSGEPRLATQLARASGSALEPILDSLRSAEQRGLGRTRRSPQRCFTHGQNRPVVQRADTGVASQDRDGARRSALSAQSQGA